MICQSIVPLFCVLAAGVTSADDPAVVAFAQRVFVGFRSRTPIAEVPPTLTLKQAQRVQKLVVAELSSDLGPVAGYKAALTSAAMRKQLGIDAPLRGVLLAKMLRSSPAEIAMPFAAVGVFEADLLVRVKSTALNDATTPQEALAALDAVIPFIELADRVYSNTVKPTAALAIAANTGARLGVMGTPIPLEATAEWEDRLKRFRVRLTNEAGDVLGEGTGSNLLDHPLNAVLFLRDSLRADAVRLKKGDLLSLGSLAPARPAQPGMTVTGRYFDLDRAGDVDVVVRFRP